MENDKAKLIYCIIQKNQLDKDPNFQKIIYRVFYGDKYTEDEYQILFCLVLAGPTPIEMVAEVAGVEMKQIEALIKKLEINTVTIGTQECLELSLDQVDKISGLITDEEAREMKEKLENYWK